MKNQQDKLKNYPTMTQSGKMIFSIAKKSHPVKDKKVVEPQTTDLKAKAPPAAQNDKVVSAPSSISLNSDGSGSRSGRSSSERDKKKDAGKVRERNAGTGAINETAIIKHRKRPSNMIV